jgi:hypothetical protein
VPRVGAGETLPTPSSRRLADLAEPYGGEVPLPQEALAELARYLAGDGNRVLREQQSAARSS